jgi:protein SCO1/2
MKQLPSCLLWIIMCSALLVVGCKPDGGSTPTANEGSITNYTVRGVVRSLKPDENEVVIRHEEIAGYMVAMTMPFTVRERKDLDGLQSGDSVEFRLRVTEKDAWIDQIRVVSRPPKTTPAEPAAAEPTTNARSAIRILPNVPDLKVGEGVPEYAFTNQFGAPFSLSQFRGQAVALTFIFTRCPYPLFCPRMSDQFATAQKQLLARNDGPTNWHLISLSFDPEFDTPETMKAYGERWNADPKHWTLATGSFDQIEPLAVSSGLYFGRGVSIADQNHNLRTLVIRPDGTLQEMLVGNQWTAEELTEALVKAAAAKP